MFLGIFFHSTSVLPVDSKANISTIKTAFNSTNSSADKLTVNATIVSSNVLSFSETVRTTLDYPHYFSIQTTFECSI